MVQEEVTEQANTEWANSIVSAFKRYGSLRFYADYRKFKVVTVMVSYFLPRMIEWHDSLREGRIFSTLDAISRYRLIEIDEQDRSKSEFCSHHGPFQFVWMPFGLRNAPVTFQRVMNITLLSVKWQSALLYLNHIVVFLQKSKSPMAQL